MPLDHTESWLASQLLKARQLWDRYDQILGYVAWIASLAAGAALVVWKNHSTDVPISVLMWTLPVVGTIALMAILGTHARVQEVYPGHPMTPEVCRAKIGEALDQLKGFKLSKSKAITIDVIGVSLSHSHTWIESELANYLRSNPKARVELRIIFVDPLYMGTFGFEGDDGEPTWEQQINERITWFETHMVTMINDFGSRLEVTARLINNLPHWHGVLIERNRLFLGRVSWEDGNERAKVAPKQLTCAKNGYRFYTPTDPYGGSERIKLFRMWLAHYCYGAHSGRQLWPRPNHQTP